MLWSLLWASVTPSDFPHLFQPNPAAQNSQQRPALQGFYLAKIWPKETDTFIPLSISDTPRVHWPPSHRDHCVGSSSFQELNSCLDPTASLNWVSHNHRKRFLEVPFGMALYKLHQKKVYTLKTGSCNLTCFCINLPCRSTILHVP